MMEKALHATRNLENPDCLPKFSYSFGVLSFPPAVINMMLSRIEIIRDAFVGSGSSGCVSSMRMTFPFGGKAL